MDDITAGSSITVRPEWGDDFVHDDCEDEVECGLMPNGQCLLAGSEWCDWDCGRLE